MTQPIDKAYIELLPDTRKFGSAAREQIKRAMGSVSSAATEFLRAAEKSVRDSGNRINYDWKQSSGEVNKSTSRMARQVADDANKGFGQAREASGRFAREGPAGVRSATTSIGDAFSGVTTRAVAFGTAIGTASVFVARGMFNAAKSAVTSGIQMAAGLEQAQIGFTTLLGSGQKAQTFLSQLQTFAASTPFELPGLIDASRQLIGVGLNTKQTMSTLTAFGDASGALGISQEGFNRIMLATSQALSAGTLHAGDLLQMTEAGLPVWKLLSESMHKPVSEIKALSEQGKLMTADVLPKLNAQMEKDYGGAMAKQSQTLTGLWSTMMDTFHIGMANTLIPMEPLLRSAIPAAAGFMQSAFKTTGNAAGEFFGGLTGHVKRMAFDDRAQLEKFGLGIRAMVLAFQGAGVTSDGFIGRMERVGVALREGWIRIKQVADTVRAEFGEALRNLATAVLPILIQAWQSFREPMRAVGQFLLTVLLPAFTQFTAYLATHQNVVRNVAQVIGILVLAWRAYRIAQMLATAATAVFNVVARANPIGIVVTAIAGLVAAFVVAYQHSAKFRDIVQQVWARIKVFAAAVVAAWPAIQQVILRAWSAIQPALMALWNLLLTLFNQIIRPLVAWIVAHWPQIAAVMKVVFAIVGALLMVFITQVRIVANIISWLVQKVVGPMFRLMLSTITVVINLVIGVWQGAQRAWNNVVNAVKATMNALVFAFTRLPGILIGVFARALTFLYTAGQNIIRGLWNGIQSLAGWIVNLVRGIPGWVVRAVGSGLSVLAGFGADIVRGLWEGIKSLGSWIWNQVKSIIPGWIKDALGIHSMPRWAIDAGVWILKGIAHGIISAPGKFLGALKDKALALIKSIGGGFVPQQGGFHPGNFPGNLAQWIDQALMLTHTPMTWFDAIARRINFESGGNPNAINNWDSNAQAGDPSRGLMQTIGATFAAYHQPGTSSNIYDPVANIAAAINYIKARYGSIFSIDPPVQGYAAGTYRVPRTGPALLHRDEAVMPKVVADWMRNMGGGGGPVDASSLAAAISIALDGTTITMDGRVVGEIVTKYQDMQARKGTRR